MTKYPKTDVIEEKTFKQSEEPKIKKEKLFVVVFKENRSYERRIGHVDFRWEPRGKEGDSRILTKSQIENSDFQTCKKRFVIKEK